MHPESSSQVTVDSIAAGVHPEICRFVAGRRALVFVALSKNDLGVVTVALDRKGEPDRVIHYTRIWRDRIAEFAETVATTKKALGVRE